MCRNVFNCPTILQKQLHSSTKIQSIRSLLVIIWTITEDRTGGKSQYSWMNKKQQGEKVWEYPVLSNVHTNNSALLLHLATQQVQIHSSMTPPHLNVDVGGSFFITSTILDRRPLLPWHISCLHTTQKLTLVSNATEISTLTINNHHPLGPTSKNLKTLKSGSSDALRKMSSVK